MEYLRAKGIYWRNGIYWEFNAVGFSSERKASLLGLLAEALGLLAGGVDLLAELDWILTLYYGILADGGFLLAERDLLRI